jgi:hypothetical protein
VDEPGGYFGERDQDEPSAVKLGMGKSQIAAVQDGISHQEQIQIDGPGTVVAGALTSLQNLYGLTYLEKTVWLETTVYLCNGVREPRLGRRVDRFRSVETRDLVDSNRELIEAAQSSSDLSLAVTQIGAKSYVTVTFGHARHYTVGSSERHNSTPAFPFYKK